jgi:hypothetical protein
LDVALFVGDAVKVLELVIDRVPLAEEVPVFDEVIEDVAVLLIIPVIVFLGVFENEGEADGVFEACILLLFVALDDCVLEIADDLVLVGQDDELFELEEDDVVVLVEVVVFVLVVVPVIVFVTIELFEGMGDEELVFEFVTVLLAVCVPVVVLVDVLDSVIAFVGKLVRVLVVVFVDVFDDVVDKVGITAFAIRFLELLLLDSTFII